MMMMMIMRRWNGGTTPPFVWGSIHRSSIEDPTLALLLVCEYDTSYIVRFAFIFSHVVGSDGVLTATCFDSSFHPPGAELCKVVAPPGWAFSTSTETQCSVRLSPHAVSHIKPNHYYLVKQSHSPRQTDCVWWLCSKLPWHSHSSRSSVDALGAPKLFGFNANFDGVLIVTCLIDLVNNSWISAR
jgi:hypothetical protein